MCLLEIIVFYFGFGGCVLRLRKFRLVVVRMILVIFMVIWIMIEGRYSGMIWC